MFGKSLFSLLSMVLVCQGASDAAALDLFNAVRLAWGRQNSSWNSPCPREITLLQDGKFVAQMVRMINDSRGEETRYAEIRETLLMIVFRKAGRTEVAA